MPTLSLENEQKQGDQKVNALLIINSKEENTSKNEVVLKQTIQLKQNETIKEYKSIWPNILERIQNAQGESNIGSNYFSNSTNFGGRITEYNRPAFSYMLPRIRCIVENLFQLTYKRKIYYKTAFTICKSLEEMILSPHLKSLPGDFPFFEDLLKLHEQFEQLTKFLEDNKEGMKFTLSKSAIVRYILILNLIRECAKKMPFPKLFPELYKPKIEPKPEPKTRKYAV
ncbi:MAG: hypothetical protein ABIP51_04800 [Bacteroidia bacterium]